MLPISKMASCAAVLAYLSLPHRAAAVEIPSDLQNPQIDIAYVEPTNAALRPIEDRLKQRQVLEQLKAFLAPLRLSSKLAVRTAECGNKDVHYKPGGPVTLCYEYVALVEQLAAGLPPSLQQRVGNRVFTRDDAIAGAVAHKLLHEVARAVFDIEKIPVWGREEFAADRTAGFIMLHFGDSIAYRSFIGASWFLSQAGVVVTGIPGGDFYSVRGADMEILQRFATTLCVALGGNPKVFAFLKKSLPKARADSCRWEYLQLEHSFNEVVMPLIDRDLLKRVQAIEWL